MTQSTKTPHTLSQAHTPAALACPRCELCSLQTRFVGLESLPDNDRVDLCTYECNSCGHVQAELVRRETATNNVASRLLST
jgi:C4-type Zn-finger protein